MSTEVKQEGEFKVKKPSKPKNLGQTNNETIKVDLTSPEATGEIKPEITKVVIKEEDDAVQAQETNDSDAIVEEPKDSSNSENAVIDKISSKNESIKLSNGNVFIYKDLAIKSLKCSNSQLDDNPETKAYIQVRDLTLNDNDKVYVFNGWMFSSSPSIAPFDHPVYDIWLTKCY